MASFLDHQIFRPTGSVDARPEDLGLDYEEVFLTAGDGVRLHAWFFPGGSGVTLVFFHGNAGDISHRLDMIPVLQAGLDASILLFDYRGYGRSEGAPTERGVYLDSLAAAEWARQREGTRAVVYYGRSLGAAAAIETALREPPDALIIEAAFLSVAEMAAVSHPFIGLVSWLWLRGRFDKHGQDSPAGRAPAGHPRRRGRDGALRARSSALQGRATAEGGYTPWRAPATATLFSSPASSTRGASTGSCGGIWATVARRPVRAIFQGNFARPSVA